MASIVRDIKEKLSTAKDAPDNSVGDSAAPPAQRGSDEQTFNILPHPAKSNDPVDLQKPSENTGGLGSSQGAFEAFKAPPGPVILDQGMLNSLGPAETPEELQARQVKLNKKS